MTEYIKLANSAPLYAVVAIVLGFVALCCVAFMVISYRAGVKIGMDRKVLNKTITSSALFTIFPAVAILLGVIALSGSLGIPTAWLRLSVVGNLSYEALAANAAAEGMGIALSASELTADHFVTIIAVMTSGICFGMIACILVLKPYARKTLERNSAKSKPTEKKNFADWAMVALFIGMCSAFIGSYISNCFVAPRGKNPTLIPLLTALISGISMTVIELIEKKFNIKWLDSFSLAFSMLVGMCGAIVLAPVVA